MFGVKQSKEIVRNENFNSIEKIMESDEESLKQIDGIGDVVASNIYNFFRKEKNRDIILKLKEHGIRMEVQEEKENSEDIEIVSDIFKDKIFVLTGNFSKPKKEIEKEISSTREFYNGAVRIFNNKVLVFPTVLIANMFGFKKQPYFEVKDEKERENVKVSFE